MALSFAAIEMHAQDDDFKVVGYLPNYRFHLVDSIDLSKLTHLCIAFANPTSRGRLSFSGMDVRPVVEKAKAAGVKPMLSLAGGGIETWKANAWKKWLQPLNQPKLIDEIMTWVRHYGFDGVDVDLEWKNVGENYSSFVIALQKALKTEDKILSAALPGTHRYKHLSDEALHSFDFINVMAYDFTGPWDAKNPGQHSTFQWTNECIDFWYGMGVAKEKLVIGLPLFGWDFSNRRRIHSVSYGFMVARDTVFANYDQIGDVYYNGLPLLLAKTELALEKAGGIMFWEIGQDAYDDKYSAIKAINALLEDNRAYAQAVAAMTGDDIEVHALPVLETTPNSYQNTPVTNHDETTTPKLYFSSVMGNIVLVKEEGVRKTVLKFPEYPAGFYLLTAILQNGLIYDSLVKQE